MKRSVIRGISALALTTPDCASLHPGYARFVESRSSLRGFDMIDSPEARAQATAREKLQAAIGLYITQFANLETIVASHVGYVLDIEPALAFFILKELGFDQKIKLLRRGVTQKFGEDKSATYRPILNKITKAAEFRNTLVHGAFVADSEYGSTFLHGRLGDRPNAVVDGLTEISPDTIRQQAQSLDGLSEELIKRLPELSTPNSSSSREQSGLGDQ
jgi:hypothetical protein